MSSTALSRWTTSPVEISSKVLRRQVTCIIAKHEAKILQKYILLSGAWGCFDEFNRITVEVLSVIAVQVKCIQDGIKEETPTFDFMGEVKVTR